MLKQETPRAALPSALRWAAVAFLCACLVGGLGVGMCARHLCLIHLPKWMVSIGVGYIWLSAPWLSILNRGTGATLTAIVIGSAATVGALTFIARYWLIRLRNFIEAPLPAWGIPPNDGDDSRIPSPSPLTIVAALLLALAVGSVAAVTKHGLSFDTLKRLGAAFAIMILLVAIPFYFEVRRSRQPNKLEVALAVGWMALRRLLLGVAAMLFALSALASLRSGALFVGSFSLLLAAALAWWGWVGAGYSRRFSDDLPAHKARKRRYGWK